MDARFMIENPSNIEATMKITMKIQDWLELRDHLQNNWPSGELTYKINDLVTQAKKTFYAAEMNDQP